MRLIDADELLYVLCQEEMKMRSVLSKSNNETFDKGKLYELLLITNVIKEQPTAYDVDKVCEEIDRYSVDNTDWSYSTNPKLASYYLLRTKDAIDIVKRGINEHNNSRL